jgi:hypothetical protein
MLADGNQTGNERLIEWWRFDRMSTVYRPGSGRVHRILRRRGQALRRRGGHLPSPSRYGNRKGVVEKANDSLAQRWWRSVPDDLSRRRPRTGWTRSASGSATPSARPSGAGGANT